MNIEIVLTRRQLLFGVVALGFGGALTQAERVTSRFLPSAPGGEDLPPYGTYNAVVAIHRDANLRTSPRIPDRTRFSQPSNTIDWQQMHSVNGTEFPGISPDAFVVSNPELVKGQYTENNSINISWSPWIKLAVSLRNGESMPAYVNLYGGRPYVESLNGGYTLSAGDRNYAYYINYQDIGQILIPSSEDRVARDTVPLVWANIVSRKLSGTMPLRPWVKSPDKGYSDAGEMILPTAEVVAAGDSWEEKTKMERDQTPINVRNYPRKYYYDDEPVEILGTVRQGTEIRNLLVDDFSSWSTTKRSDVKGELYDQSGNPVDIDPNQIVAIYNSYLKY